MHRIHEFKNGLRLIHQQVDSKIAHLGVIIDAGTRDEEERAMGMAHFIEHMLFKGTKKRSSLQVLNRLEEVGGEMNAYTTKDKTCIYASFVSTYLDRAFELLADVTFNSTYPEKEMEKEKKVILEEIDMYADNPEECIYDEFQELLFRSHPLGYNILGRPETVSSFTQNQVIDFVTRNYSLKNIVISYVGETPFNQLVKLCEKYIPVNKTPEETNKRKKFSRYKTFNITKETTDAQSYCVIGNMAYGNHHRRKNALLLLSNLLGGTGLNSKLNLAVREKYGYAYNIESNYTAYDDCGYFNIFFGTDGKNQEKTIAIVHRELKKLRDSKIPASALIRYKKQMEGQLLLAEENKSGLMLALGKSLHDYNRADTLEQIIEKINAVSAEDILETANEIFDEKNLSYLLYKNTGQ